MISFCIKFLICFIKPEPPPKKETKKTKGKKSLQQTKKGKQKKLSKPSKTEEPKEDIPEIIDPNVVKCCENAREWCHIEYCLFDDVLPTVEINVVTWGEAAKVYTAEECRAIKTVIINDFVWVYFTMMHKVTAFNDEELLKFKDSKIKFKFSQDIKKMMPSAANDWPKEFMYAGKNSFTSLKDRTGNENIVEDDSRWFSELQQTDPLIENVETLSQTSECFKINRPAFNSVVSMIRIRPCEKSMTTRLLQTSATLPPKKISEEVTKKGKGKKNSKKGDKNKKKDSKLVEENKGELYLRSQLLIAGKYDAPAEGKDVSPSVRYAGVFVSSTDILREEQTIAFVPFVVNIQKLEALPIEKLQELKIKNVFVRYELENVLNDIETVKVPPADNIPLEDIQVFFLSSREEQTEHSSLMIRPSMVTLAESLLTRPLVVKLFGEREADAEEVDPCIFGDRHTDLFISTPDHEMFTTYSPPLCSNNELFLGSASFNLINLIKGYDVVESCSILTSSPLPFWNLAKETRENMGDVPDTTDRRSLEAALSAKRPIPEPLFIEHCSRINVKISSFCQLTTLSDHQLLNLPQAYFRVIVVFYDHSDAEKTVEIIDNLNRPLSRSHCSVSSLSHSATSLNLKMLKAFKKEATTHWTPRYSLISKSSGAFSLSQKASEISDHRKRSRLVTFGEQRYDSYVSEKSITGFIVEHEEESILVIESLAIILPNIIEPLKPIVPSNGKVICDTSLFFSKRLYPECYPLLKIKLSKSLNELLQFPTFYKSSASKQALQTILKLDLLRRSRTLNSACVNQVFPSYDQLNSFRREFGGYKSFLWFLDEDTSTSQSSELEDDELS